MHRGRVDQQVLELNVRELIFHDARRAIARHRREVSSTLALSMDVTCVDVAPGEPAGDAHRAL